MQIIADVGGIPVKIVEVSAKLLFSKVKEGIPSDANHAYQALLVVSSVLPELENQKTSYTPFMVINSSKHL
jgi:hypothetical protein